MSKMTKTARNHELTDAAAVAAQYGEPSVMARNKTMTRLDKYAHQFIACAPFMVMVTDIWTAPSSSLSAI